MKRQGLDRWLGWLRGAATFVYIAALCLAVALLVIGNVSGSVVQLELSTRLLSGLHGVHGVAPGVVVDPTGEMLFKITDPSLVQRLLSLATTVPALLLVALVARRMASMLRAAQDTDPFTEQTARELTVVAMITAFGGVAVWALGSVATSILSATVLDSGATLKPHHSPFGWLAVGLIFAAFAQLIGRGVAMRAELDTVI